MERVFFYTVTIERVPTGFSTLSTAIFLYSVNPWRYLPLQIATMTITPMITFKLNIFFVTVTSVSRAAWSCVVNVPGGLYSMFRNGGLFIVFDWAQAMVCFSWILLSGISTKYIKWHRWNANDWICAYRILFIFVDIHWDEERRFARYSILQRIWSLIFCWKQNSLFCW